MFAHSKPRFFCVGPRTAESQSKFDEAALAGGVAALRHAVFALGNLGVMDANKALLLKAGAVTELVRLTVHPDEELHKVRAQLLVLCRHNLRALGQYVSTSAVFACQAVDHALKILGDLNDSAEHEAKREKIKVDAIVETISSSAVSTTQRGAAAEMLLEESVTTGLGSMQSKIERCGGIAALIDLIKVCSFAHCSCRQNLASLMSLHSLVVCMRFDNDVFWVHRVHSALSERR